jgi:tripartite-type tricarboxylate transporter receptor subunit TctC
MRTKPMLAAVLVLLGAFCPAAFGQAYPQRSITILVPLQAGSAGDAMIRIVAQKMAESLKQGLVIDNQPGVSGLLGAEKVAKASPDGYLIGGISDSVLNFAANLAPKVNFDPVKDFAPVSLIADVSWVLVANPKFGARTLNEFIELARAKPGTVDFASAGNGSPHHIAMELLSRSVKIKLVHVPYKGASQATVDVVADQVPVMFTATSVALPFIKEGKLLALGVPAEKRSVLLPGVATFGELGVKGFNFSTWVALYAPLGTPGAIISRLNTEVRKAVDDPVIRDKLLSLALEPHPTTPEELGRLTAEGNARIRKIIQEASIKAD